MKNAIYIIILLLNSLSLLTQEAVVSEYYNSNDFNNEWTEILVTKDKTNLVGYSIRDNSEDYNDGDKWQGGVKFNNVALWKNLRVGTVIVINHRGVSSQDIDPSDGHIEIDAENTTYFSKDNWGPISSLSIQKFGDVIQLRNASGANVHALAHVKRSSQGDFYQINGKKIGYVGDCDFGYSISVANADKIEDYNFNTSNLNGYDDNAIVTSHSGNYTKGRANNNKNGNAINYRFWQEIRQPKFDSPNLKANIINEKVYLGWNPIINNSENDDFGGYIILRTTDVNASPCLPEDGKAYFIGQKLCVTSEVIAIMNGKENDEFIDENPIRGKETKYSIFSFNFKNGNKSSWNEEDGRGVAYSSSIEVSSFVKVLLENPPPVTIKSRNGNKFCSIDTTILFNDIPNDEKSLYSYAWYLVRDGIKTVVIDFKEPGISDSIKIYKPGKYYLEIKNETGGITKSNEIVIEIIEQPDAFIANEEGFIFNNDTTLYYCEELDYTLRANLRELDIKEKIFLIKDNDTIGQTGEPVLIQESGVYYYIFKIDDCIDSSSKVTFKTKEFQLSSSKIKLDFIIPLTITNKIDSVYIINSSSEDYLLQSNEVQIKSPFEILNNFPINVPANSQIKIDVNFQPPLKGKYYDTLIVNGVCKSEFRIPLFGQKKITNAILKSSLDTIDFGIRAFCDDKSKDSTLTLYNLGDEYIILEDSFDHTEYKTNPIINNDTIFPGDSIVLNVFTNRNAKGQLFKLMKIAWISEFGKRDTSEIFLKLHLIEPEYEIIEEEVDFGVITGCVNSKLDSIHIYNSGLVDIIIDKDKFIDHIEVLNSPVVIPSGDTIVVYLEFSSGTPVVINQINNFSIVPGCTILLDGNLLIKARKETGTYEIDLSDTLDFGTLYNCDVIDTTLYIDIKIFNKEITDDVVVTKISSLGDFKLVGNIDKVRNNDKIPVNFNKNNNGIYQSKITFTFDPCGIERNVVLKAEVKSSDISITDSIKFDSFEQGNSNTKSLSISNSNKEDLIINNILLPNNITIDTPINFPITLSKDSNLIINVTYSSFNVGQYIDSLIVVQIAPCDISSIVYLNGTVLPTNVPPGNFIVRIDVDRQIIAPKSTINIPISIYEDIYTFDMVDLESISIILDYPFNALELLEIEPKQTGTKIIENDQNGNLELILSNIDGSDFKLTQNYIINLKFLVLDAIPNEYRIDLTDGVVESFPPMFIETEDSSFIEINKNCVNTKLYTFTKPVKLDYVLNNSSLSIRLEQPTDDNYKLEIYDITGRVIEQILDGNQGRGEHYQRVDLNNISNGLYYIVLQYPNNIITKQISIIK